MVTKWIILGIPNAESSDVARYVAALEERTAEKAARCISAIVGSRSTEDGGYTYRVTQ